MDRNLQILGLSKKAGLLAVGGADTEAAGKMRKAKVVISANDASESALNRAKKSADACRAVHLEVPYSSFELGAVCGRGSPSTVAILDTGFAAKFVNGLAIVDPMKYFQAAESLTIKDEALKRRKATDANASTNAKRRTV